MKEFIKVMKAASDPNRVKILKMLQHKQMCVCEIQAVLGTAQSTASKHLKLLEDAGLVSCKKDGLWVNYELANGTQSPFAANLIGNIRHWLDDSREIREILEQLPEVNRLDILNKR